MMIPAFLQSHVPLLHTPGPLSSVCFKGPAMDLAHAPDTSLVNAFYRQRKGRLFWFDSLPYAAAKRRVLREALDSCAWFGLDRTRYPPLEQAGGLFTIPGSGPWKDLAARDSLLTGLALGFCRDLFQGSDIYQWLSYDGLEGLHQQGDDWYIVDKLAEADSDSALLSLFQSLEPRDKSYRLLKSSLKQAIHNQYILQIKQLGITLNLLRWVNHFHYDRYILVNIPSASLKYVRQDSVELEMKAVVGKPDWKTPRFGAYCNEIILYPYWNVPRKIALRELLPQFKKSPSLIDSMNMQVIDAAGRIINHHLLDWSTYNRDNFPYRFRESTGCDNSLGVIKFNLTDPFDVYMHDTNLKRAFLSSYRFRSHGCIRLEKPYELAFFLLNGHIDQDLIASCLKGQAPVPLPLEKPVPVFVLYLPAETVAGDSVRIYRDIYRLVK